MTKQRLMDADYAQTARGRQARAECSVQNAQELDVIESLAETLAFVDEEINKLSD